MEIDPEVSEAMSHVRFSREKQTHVEIRRTNVTCLCYDVCPTTFGELVSARGRKRAETQDRIGDRKGDRLGDRITSTKSQIDNQWWTEKGEPKFPQFRSPPPGGNWVESGASNFLSNQFGPISGPFSVHVFFSKKKNGPQSGGQFGSQFGGQFWRRVF